MSIISYTATYNKIIFATCIFIFPSLLLKMFILYKRFNLTSSTFISSHYLALTESNCRNHPSSLVFLSLSLFFFLFSESTGCIFANNVLNERFLGVVVQSVIVIGVISLILNNWQNITKLCPWNSIKI